MTQNCDTRSPSTSFAKVDIPFLLLDTVMVSSGSSVLGFVATATCFNSWSRAFTDATDHFDFLQGSEKSPEVLPQVRGRSLS